MKKMLHTLKTLITGSVLMLAGVNSNAQNICAAGNTISPTEIQNICVGSSANALTATITTSGSGNNGNITYTWYSNATNSTTGGTMVQTLSTNTGTVTNTFTPQVTNAGTLWYYCTVTNDGGDCAGTSYTTAAVQVNVNVLPKVYNLSGGGVRCSNGSGLSINLNGSEKGVTYQVLKNGSVTTTSFPGTGNPIGFVTTIDGSFTMIGTNGITGCTNNMAGNAIITINPSPTASYTNTPVSCQGGDGTVTVTGAGGTPGYLFNIDGGTFSTSNLFTGISAGSHTVSVKDANSCAVTISNVTVQKAPSLSVKISNVNPGNCTGSDGSITANIVGGVDDGVTPVQYKLDGDVTKPYQTNNVFGGLSKGNYTITVKDSKGCTAISSVISLTQTAGTAPTIFNLTGGGNICAGGTGVSIRLSGSETGVNYQLQKGGVSVGTALAGNGHPLNFYGNSPGTFTMVAINATAGCTSVMNGSATITVNPLPKIFNFSTNSVRCSSTTGYALNLSGSEVGVNYLLVKNGVINSSPFQGNGKPISFRTNDSTITSLTMLAINPTTGCTSPMNGSVNTTNIPINPPLTPSFTKYYASSCKGGDGTITITPGGGTPGYMYSVDGGPFGTDNFLTGLAAGDHSVVVKDANSCTITLTGITILTAPPIQPTATVISAGSCAGNDGTVIAHYYGGVVDGITPLKYKLDGEVSRPFQFSNEFDGLPPGNYTVTQMDSKGCVGSSSVVTLEQAAPLTLASSGSYQTNVSSCGNGSDGSIVITVTGGVLPFTNTINGVEHTSNSRAFGFGNLAPGNYDVVITDFRGCTLTLNYTITQTDAPIAKVNYSGNETCIGKNDGFITAWQTGGVPGYSYSKDGGLTYQGSYRFTNLSPGLYNLVVKDSKGCVSAPVSVTIKAGTVSCRTGNFSNNGTENRLGNTDENNNLSKTTFNSSLSNYPLSIQAYPNPFGSEFTLNVQGNNQDRVSVSITDVLGRRLYLAEGNANQQYKLGGSLRQGVYFVQVMQGDNVRTIKIVKE